MANLPIDSNDKLYVRNENTGSPTTFQDSSTANPKTITANGNAKQLPIKFNKSAGFFNGTTDYVAVPDSADWVFGSDFCLEGNFNWAEAPVSGTYYYLMSQYTSGNTVMNWYILLSGGVYYFAFNQISAGSYVSAISVTISAPVANTWYHYAVTQTGGNIKIFIDGVQQGATATGQASFTTDYTGALLIGGYNTSGAWKGWVKEARISNTARYTANFTPNTTQFTSDSNTKLLLHFDTPAASPIGPALNFLTHANTNGIGGMLTVPDHADWDMTDFTVECWFNSNSSIEYDVNLMLLGDTTTGCRMDYCANTDGDYSLDGFIYGTRINKALGYNLVPNAWYHYALVRSGTTAYSFVNGRLLGTTAVAGTALSIATTVKIGDGTSSYIRPIGNMREVRISNTARYTASFTPSQSGFTSDSNTLLYIKGNEANGATTFVDSSPSARTVTNAGTTNVTSNYVEDYRSCVFKDDGNTGHKPYPVGLAKVDFFAMSTGVMYSKANTDYCTVPDNTDFKFGSGDYWVEFYTRCATFSGGSNIFMFFTGASVTWGFYLSSGGMTFYSLNAIVASYAFTPVANTWMHWAAGRSGTAWKLYLNGAVVATATNSDNVTATATLYIGSWGTGSALDGLMDNIRITKGVARYTATFDPPYDPGSSATSTSSFFLVL